MWKKELLLPTQDALEVKHIAALAYEYANSIATDALVVLMHLFYDFVKVT